MNPKSFQEIFKIFIIASFILSLGIRQALSKEINLNQIDKQELEEDNDLETEININSSEIYDPFEKVNRQIFNFNEFVDKYFIEHIARGYRDYVPKSARSSIRNFLDNLLLPFTTVNSLLQGKGDNSMSSFSSFLINSTIGLGGLFDVAKNKGISYEKEDFGQTFAKYGFKSGPYLMLPLLGPSNLRDFGGNATTMLIDPLGFNVAGIGAKEEFFGNNDIIISEKIILIIDTRESLLDVIDNVRKDSFDPYATIRSAYAQRRNFLIEN